MIFVHSSISLALDLLFLQKGDGTAIRVARDGIPGAPDVEARRGQVVHVRLHGTRPHES